MNVKSWKNMFLGFFINESENGLFYVGADSMRIPSRLYSSLYSILLIPPDSATILLCFLGPSLRNASAIPLLMLSLKESNSFKMLQFTTSGPTSLRRVSSRRRTCLGM